MPRDLPPRRRRGMATVSMALIKELRERTQAPIGEVKSALEEAKGDLEEAQRILRTKVRCAAAAPLPIPAPPSAARAMTIE